ncbi:MAG: division/cell wall cluster transcriptional repressor MraZ [Planctomycetota bacterium]
MFTGIYRHSLDSKNRVTVPSKFLQAISDPAEKTQFYVTLGLDSCLFLFTLSQFHEIATQVKKSSLATPAARNFARLFFAQAGRCDLDTAGRILIPEELKQQAGLVKDVVWVGTWDRAELWAQDRWASLSEVSSRDYTANAAGTFDRQ